MRKGHIGFLPMGIFLILILGYMGLSVYYCDKFTYGTWINGIYCTGKTVAEVNTLLVEGTPVNNLHIIDEDGSKEEIPAEDFDYTVDYTTGLKRIMRRQNPILWVDGLWKENIHETKPVTSYSEKKLIQSLKALSCVKDAEKRPQKVEILLGDKGYELYNGMEHVLSMENLLTKAKAAIADEVFSLSLSQGDCYVDLELTQQMQDTLDLFAKVDTFQQCDIVYDMGDARIPLDPSITSKWILLDENGDFKLDKKGNPVLREDGIQEFIAQLAAEYDTYGSVRKFQATRGEIVEIEGGTYGNQLNQKKEVTYLTKAFQEKRSEVHVPVYKREAYVRGKNDIGDTYIEIDMTAQKMYLYEKGVLKIETDVVTGNMKKKHDTPSGVNYVYSKQRNRILKGEDYASPVKYWMPVKGNIGIHDASWRKEFGGEIYLKNGSHGCINTPYDAMKELYNSVEVGIPVVMFY